eukprot:s2809_g1.t1
MVELYAGSARLTKACQQVGVRSVAVDKDPKRSHGTKIFSCDITKTAELEMFKAFLEAEKDSLAWVHFAPACGTASRAREKPNRTLERAGHSVPKPCRSDLYPLGLPHLSGLDKVRAEAANEVYRITAELVRELQAWGVACTIENPTSSLFWKVPYIVDLVEDLGGYDLVFDSCCHGGSPKKSTKFWCTTPLFLGLEAQCDGTHVHKTWAPTVVNGVVQYPTAEEAAYPKLLCQRLAESFRAALLEQGVIDVQSLEEQQQVELPALHRLVLDALPRGKRHKPLVSEYGCHTSVFHSTQISEPDMQLPAGAKLLHQRFAKWGELRVDEGITHVSLEVDKLEHQTVVAVSQFGIPRTPEDFCSRAVSCGHPRGMSVHLPSVVTTVLEENLSMDVAELALTRCRQMAKWTLRAGQLSKDEVEYKKSLPLHLQQLVQSKRLLLMKEMLDSVDYLDKHLVRDISQDFVLTGWQEKTGVFPPCVKKPQFSRQTLKQMAKGLNKAIVGQLTLEEDTDDIVKQTWEKTLEEVSLGYIWDDRTSRWEVLLASGFGLVQKAGKLRVIDDCSIGGSQWGAWCGGKVQGYHGQLLLMITQCLLEISWPATRPRRWTAYLTYSELKEIAREGSKASGFAKTFQTLGVEIDLEKFHEGCVLIGHTADRREEIGRVLGEILIAGSVTAKQAESLRGRLHWFESFAFGRIANRAVKTVGEISLRGIRHVSLSPTDMASLRFLKDRVLQAPPLKITPACLRSWILFTDGACEGPDGAKVCWYLDNDAGRSAFIKAYGATQIADGMVEAFTEHEMNLQIRSWFARVPSASNIADAPSRNEDSFLRDRGAVKVAVMWQMLRDVLSRWTSRKGEVSAGDKT